MSAATKNGDPARFFLDKLQKLRLQREEIEAEAKEYGVELPEMEEPVFTQTSGESTKSNGDIRGPSIPKPTSAFQLIEDYPNKRPTVIDGLLRRGETANAIAAAKVGKSWLMYLMLLCVACGRDWLGHPTTQGKVLLIDNEIHPEELSSRLNRVAYAMGVSDECLTEQVQCLPLRGQLLDINRLRQILEPLKGQGYSLVVLDAFYRFLPEKVSENDNAQMAAVFNTVDFYAALLDCAIVLVHHSTKGDQSQKSVTDTGSGAGAISRAADTHLIIRPHEIDGCAVLEGVCRSFAPIEPTTLKWEWPLWSVSDIEPEVKSRKTPGRIKQERDDKEADETIIEKLRGSKKGLTKPQLRTATGYGPGRVDRAVCRLEQAGAVNVKKGRSRQTGKRIERVTLLGDF